ncbi:MAG: hypothetical protein IPO70_09875, partial [Bacteroidetes bacterium]|nr:hypothetical protein [Bacteroidota bacterium]
MNHLLENIKKVIYFILLAVVLQSCASGDDGQLIGAQNRETWYDFNPYGMLS